MIPSEEALNCKSRSSLPMETKLTLVEVEIIGLQEVLTSVSLRLEAQAVPGRRDSSNFRNGANREDRLQSTHCRQFRFRRQIIA
jgi:hypothetical protein